MAKELRSERTDDLFKHYVIARIEKAGERFEVLVKPEAVQKIRDGKDVDVLSSLAIDEIFRDAHKGSKASSEKMKEFFETDDPLAVAKILIKKGEIQLTTEQRREMQEQKRRQIVQYIAANAINPQTGAPPPPPPGPTAEGTGEGHRPTAHKPRERGRRDPSRPRAPPPRPVPLG